MRDKKKDLTPTQKSLIAYLENGWEVSIRRSYYKNKHGLTYFIRKEGQTPRMIRTVTIKPLIEAGHLDENCRLVKSTPVVPVKINNSPSIYAAA